MCRDSDSSSSIMFSDVEETKDDEAEDIKLNPDTVVNYTNFNLDSMKQCDHNLRIREDTAAYLLDLDSNEIDYSKISTQ